MGLWVMTHDGYNKVWRQLGDGDGDGDGELAGKVQHVGS